MEDFKDVITALTETTNVVGGELIRTWNARDIWKFVESKQDFSDWIKNRIAKYGFVEGQDFTIHKFMVGKATAFDYFCTLDMGKHLGMLEANEKGSLIRKYFIYCEKIAKGVVQELTPLEMIREQLDHLIAVEKAQKALEIATAKLEKTQNTHGEVIARLEQDVKELNKDTDYRSILAYAKHCNVPMPTKVANALGKKASKYCKENDIHIGKMSHEYYGSVNTYPIKVLELIFSNN